MNMQRIFFLNSPFGNWGPPNGIWYIFCSGAQKIREHAQDQARLCTTLSRRLGGRRGNAWVGGGSRSRPGRRLPGGEEVFFIFWEIFGGDSIVFPVLTNLFHEYNKLSKINLTSCGRQDNIWEQSICGAMPLQPIRTGLPKGESLLLCCIYNSPMVR